MSNMSSVIKQLNCKLLSTKKCGRLWNCRNKDSCSLDGKCVQTSDKFILPLPSQTRPRTFKTYLAIILGFTCRASHSKWPRVYWFLFHLLCFKNLHLPIILRSFSPVIFLKFFLNFFFFLFIYPSPLFRKIF